MAIGRNFSIANAIHTGGKRSGLLGGVARRIRVRDELLTVPRQQPCAALSIASFRYYGP